MAHKTQKSPSQTPNPEPLAPLQPNYRAMRKPLATMGPNGDQRGELDGPRGIAYHEKTREIFVVDEKNSRIQIFFIDGQFSYEFGDEDLDMPSSLLIADAHLFVTDWAWLGHSLFKYDLKTLKLKKKVGKNSFDPEKGYNLLRQPTAAPNGHIYIPDNNNNRICVFTNLLERIKVIKCEGMSGPVDVKFCNDQMYVLSNVDKMCIHVCTLAGDRIESIITRGEFRARMQVQFPSYFLIDPDNNIVISDFNDHLVKVFNASGRVLLYKVGGHGEEMGELAYPMGICLTRNGELVVASENSSFGVQVFGSLINNN